MVLLANATNTLATETPPLVLYSLQSIRSTSFRASTGSKKHNLGSK